MFQESFCFFFFGNNQTRQQNHDSAN